MNDDIEINLAIPYCRDGDSLSPMKLEFKVSFGDTDRALEFIRKLNELVLKFRKEDRI